MSGPPRKAFEGGKEEDDEDEEEVGQVGNKVIRSVMRCGDQLKRDRWRARKQEVILCGVDVRHLLSPGDGHGRPHQVAI